MKVVKLQEIQQRSLDAVKEVCFRHQLTISETFEVIEAVRDSIEADLKQTSLADVNIEHC